MSAQTEPRRTGRQRRVAAGTLTAFACFLALVFSIGLPSGGRLSAQSAPAHGLVIPPGNVMVYWTPERLAQARQWYQSSGGSWGPRRAPTEAAAVDNAFVYLMTGDATAARLAINWAATFSFYSTGPGNEGRWFGESQILVFSWLKDLFTAAERRTTIESINRAIANDLQKAWGGPDSPANNYNWGFTRNAVLWGVASYNEAYVDPSGRTQRQIADDFLNHALVTRWRNVTAPYYSGEDARGGTLPEGSHYGPYLLDYMAVPFVTTRLLGRPMTADTNFFKEAVYAVIYATTPRPTYGSARHPIAPRYQVFAYGDEQDNDGFPPTGKYEYGNYMAVAAQEWGSTAVGQYARYWLNRVQPVVHGFFRSTDAAAGQAGLPFSGLPLDYYAPGAGYFYTRDTWGATAADKPTLMLFQLEQARGAHAHCDAGSFQILRNDRWLSRETPGRSSTYAGPTGSVADTTLWMHNTLVVDYRNIGPYCFESASPQVTRLETRPAYAYAAVDLSRYYALSIAPSIVREMVNVRGLDTLVVFDRIRSTADVAKTANVHFQTAPTRTGNVILSTNGTEQVRVVSLTPMVSGQTTTYTVIDEASAGGGSGGSWEPQYRLQIDTRGTLDSYHINVLQARSVGDSDVTATLGETSSAFTVTLSQPGQSNVVLTFNKGMTSSGGGIQVGTAQFPFASAVQSITAGDAGVAWGGQAPGTRAPLPPAGVRIIR